jgi:hypothetical protein
VLTCPSERQQKILDSGACTVGGNGVVAQLVAKYTQTEDEQLKATVSAQLQRSIEEQSECGLLRHVGNTGRGLLQPKVRFRI